MDPDAPPTPLSDVQIVCPLPDPFRSRPRCAGSLVNDRGTRGDKTWFEYPVLEEIRAGTLSPIRPYTRDIPGLMTKSRTNEERLQDRL